MSSSAEIALAINRRLAEARQQIESLEKARAALSGETVQTRRTRRRPARAQNASARAASARAAGSMPARAAVNRAPAAATPTPAPASAETTRETRAAKAPARATAPAVPARPRRRRARELEPGQIEALLRDAPGGRSSAAIAKETGVSDAKVRQRLRELQSAGEIRSEGARRTSLWRLVGDEERVAARAAELEQATKGAAK